MNPAQSTFHQHNKEEANDYRYFPDPDLVPVDVGDEWLKELKSQIGELPAARRKRYIESLGLSPADAGILAGDRETGDFFESAGGNKRVANLILSHGRRLENERSTPLRQNRHLRHDFAEVAALAGPKQSRPQQRRRDFRSIGCRPMHRRNRSPPNRA